ncbi:MAG: sigma-E factor regulatory protein RseB domain-containing protein [Actinomycetes bacterium]
MISPRALPLTSVALALGLAMTVYGAGTLPVARAAQDPPPLEREQAALGLLERAAHAARSVGYRGTQFISAWDPSGTTAYIADVAHAPGHGVAVQVESTPETPGGAVFSSDGRPVLGLEGPTGGALALLARNYDLRVAGTGRVAGRDAHVVEALRTDRSVAGRFWLDAATGLVLRRHALDSAGRTVRASAYVDIAIGRDQVALTHLPPVLPQPWTTRVSEAGLRRMRAAGWSCPQGLPDRLALYDARRQPLSGSGPGGVLHLSYSDGLSTVSVFQQRGRLEGVPAGYRPARVHGLAVHVHEGLPRRVVWSADGTVYTVFAEAPWETVQAVVTSLPHEEEESGMLNRVGRGFGRVVSWLNPFG